MLLCNEFVTLGFGFLTSRPPRRSRSFWTSVNVHGFFEPFSLILRHLRAFSRLQSRRTTLCIHILAQNDRGPRREERGEFLLQPKKSDVRAAREAARSPQGTEATPLTV